MADFKAIAEAALEDNPQQLEALQFGAIAWYARPGDSHLVTIGNSQLWYA